MQGAPLLEMHNVSRHYGAGDHLVRALNNASLSIAHGEFIAIMGQSGSGKSTLMNIMGCLDSASEGTYKIQGADVSNLTPDELAELRRRTFGFVFQRYNLLGNATALENVEIPALYAGMKKADRATRARALLARLGLGDRAHHKPSELSGGQQQRVAIARALMNDPPVILADEPTGALDSTSGRDVMQLLKSLHEEGRTIILITHDEKVAAHARRIIHIADGEIVSKNDSSPPERSFAARQGERPGEGVSTFALVEPPPHLTSPPVALLRGRGTLSEIEEASKTAMRALRANLFRTALTLLGIVIGVAAVVTMMAVGAGSQKSVLDQISAMGTNLLSVRPGAPNMRASGDIATLTPEDAEAVAALPNVEAVLPERNARLTLRYGNLDYATSVNGTGEALPLVRDWPVASGAFFTERDRKSYAPVIVLGKTVATNLFGDADPVGKYVLVRNIPFQVIGVLSVKGASNWGGDQDDTALVPLTTGLARLFGQTHVNSMTVKAIDAEQINATQEQIRQTLIARHGMEDFSIRNMASILQMATQTQNTLTILLGTVAAISLLVGGIGVMNIMLVSVTERTREIGIRMATGARRRDIMLQFNTESAVVCTIGGILGVALGFLTGWGLSLFEVKTIFSPFPALIAFSCAFATGLVFGWLPARKAANMDPVAALASE